MKYLTMAILLMSSPAIAQGTLDPLTMQKALDVIANQRNLAMNDAALAQARIAILEDEVRKLRQELAEQKTKEPK